MESRTAEQNARSHHRVDIARGSHYARAGTMPRWNENHTFEQNAQSHHRVGNALGSDCARVGYRELEAAKAGEEYVGSGRGARCPRMVSSGMVPSSTGG